MLSVNSSAGSGSWTTCWQAFLFSLVNPHGLRPTKLPLIKSQQNAICLDSSCGPSFGAGSDLRILENANSNTSSHSRLGSSYESPSGPNNYTFFTGSEHFSVTDNEVFGLHDWHQTLQWITPVKCFAQLGRSIGDVYWWRDIHKRWLYFVEV